MERPSRSGRGSLVPRARPGEGRGPGTLRSLTEHGGTTGPAPHVRARGGSEAAPSAEEDHLDLGARLDGGVVLGDDDQRVGVRERCDQV